GETRRPYSVRSSAVLPMTVISASGWASSRPRRNRAAPIPPASTVMRTRPSVPRAGKAAYGGPTTREPTSSTAPAGWCHRDVGPVWEARCDTGNTTGSSAVVTEATKRWREIFGLGLLGFPFFTFLAVLFVLFRDVDFGEKVAAMASSAHVGWP